MTISDLQITHLGQRGEGVANHEGAKIFVPFALPGETVSAKISGQRAILEQIKSPSPQRAQAHCQHFGTCGGCQVQHLAPEPILMWKRDLIVQQLARVDLHPEIAPTIDAHGDGRRRATFHATPEGAGFNRHNSHELIILERCPLMVDALKPATGIATAIAKIIGNCDAAFTATISGLDVAVSKFVANGKKAFTLTDAHRTNLSNLARTQNLARISFAGEIVAQRQTPHIKFDDMSVALPTSSFLQPTQKGEEILSALVIEAVGKSKKVADLFCGLGPFALRLAKKSQIYAVDSDAAAVQSLDETLQNTPGLKRIGAEAIDLFRLPLMPKQLDRFDAIVLDPPRAGAQQQVRELARSKVKKLVYISCDPASFARDAALLIKGGFKLEKVTPVDQFRHSAHVELVAKFAR